MTIRFRVSFAVVLLLVLFGAGSHYDMESDDQWPYPTADDLAEGYERYTGEPILLFGTVRDVNPIARTASIEIEHSNSTLVMIVNLFDAQVEPGGRVQVYGTLEPNYTITAERVVVVNPADSSKWYKYTVSVLGALLFLLAFFRSWRIDTETLAFERRNNG